MACASCRNRLRHPDADRRKPAAARAIGAGPRGRAFRILPGQYLAGKWHVGGVRQVTSTDQAMELLVGLTKSTRPSWTKRSRLKIPTEWIVPYAPPPGGAACAHADHDRRGCETAANTAISHGWIRGSSPPSPVRPGWRSSTSPPLR